MRDNTIELRHAITQLYSKVKRFKQKSSTSWNFRCPVCGDSEKSATLARGNIYQNSKGGYSYKCFNCGEAKSAAQFLKDNFKELYDEYRLAIFKDRKEQEKQQKEIYAPATNCFDKTLLVPAEKSLEARIYLADRMIPEDKWKYFYYCKKIGSFIKANRTDGKYDKLRDDGEWLVTPIINWVTSSKKEVVQSVCCRNIAKDAGNNRYRHAKFRDDCLHDQVIWGLDKIDKRKPIICCEGIFDALFIDNAIALLTSVKTLQGYDDCEVIYLLDNEPRNKDIVHIAEKHAKAGRTISLLPERYNKYGKDINDFIKKGIDIQTLQDDILCHTYSGPRAILEIQKWRKI